MSRILYKYTKAEFIDSILKDGGRVKLSTRDNLNDSCDLNFVVTKENFDKSFRLLLNAAFICEYANESMFLRNKTFQTSYKLLLKNMKLTNKFEPEPVIDLSMKIYLQKRNALSQYFKRNQSVFNETYSDILENLKDKTLLGCLTTDYANRVMWTHYADGFKGICVEYEFDDEENLQDVIYTDNDNNFDLCTLMKYVLPTQYFGYPKNDGMSKECQIASYTPFLKKPEEYSYEKEIRMVFTTESKPIINDKGVWFYPNARVKSIYVGNLISKEQLLHIKEKCKNIPIYKMKIEKGSTKISFVKLEGEWNKYAAKAITTKS